MAKPGIRSLRVQAEPRVLHWRDHMMEYTFLSCHKEEHNGSAYLFADTPRSYRMTSRLALILDQLELAYREAFPEAPALRIGVIVEPRNGATGNWSVAKSATEGPIFVIEVDPALDGNELVFAHELAHPILRLLGVPTGRSIEFIDKRIGDQFTSASHHPFIFDLLEQCGYGDEQRAFFLESAETELRKLSSADFSALTYTGQIYQTWLALWYFDLYLLVTDSYEMIYSTHKKNAPEIADKMDYVLESWMLATGNEGIMERRAPVASIREFQFNLLSRLELADYIELQCLDEWKMWLFNRI